MTRKKPNRSRIQQYKSQRKKSWIAFLAKLSFFFVPIIAGTIWLALYIIGLGGGLPILVLDLDAPSESGPPNQAFKRISYGKSNSPRGIELPEKIEFGGPDNNVLVVFNDLLGSTNEDLEPIVFVPSNLEEHQTQAYRGLLRAELPVNDSGETTRWRPFADYVTQLIDGVVANAKLPADTANVILVFDIDHPDLPGRLPPQANRFIEQALAAWNAPSGINAKLAESHVNLRVHLWLSHSPGQMSYYDSAPKMVESFFKRRFELGIAGDVKSMTDSSPRDILYSDLKNYLKKWVESDSRNHKLAQSPLFLEPDGFEDFKILRTSFLKKVAASGDLFLHPSVEGQRIMRDRQANSALDELWLEFEKAKSDQAWSRENPLAVQRANMLLTQMEKLWYVARDRTQLFDELDLALKELLKSQTTIDPVKHTLWDAAYDMETDSTFDLNWIDGALIEADSVGGVSRTQGASESSDSPEAAIADAEKRAADRRKESRAAIEQWKLANTSPEAAVQIWRAVMADAKLTPARIAVALTALDDHQKYVQRSETIDDASDLASVHWNEIGYLQRLANPKEMLWPNDQATQTNLRKLVLQSLRLRDQANRFAATCVPALAKKFAAEFQQIENLRRHCEDRLFAQQLDAIRTDKPSPPLSRAMLDCSVALNKLQGRHDSLRDAYLLIQEQLTLAPHEVRYALESLAVRSQLEPGTVAEFRQQNLSEQGWLERWTELGRHTIGQLTERADAEDEIARLVRVTTQFASLRANVFASGSRLATSGNGIEDFFAADPVTDQVKFEDVDSLNAADGNLLGRRLLGWPGLDLQTRKRIRNGLATEKVDLGGSTAESQPDQTLEKSLDAVKSQKAARELAGLLADPAFASLQLERQGSSQPDADSAIALPPQSTADAADNEQAEFEPADEDYLIEVAFEAHRLPVSIEDETAINVAMAINDYRSIKSDIDFQRVKKDLVATPAAGQSGAGAPFVLAALRNHQSLIDSRVANQLAELGRQPKLLMQRWQRGGKQSWPAAIGEIESFCKNFGQFKWIRESGIALNSSIAQRLLDERDQDMVFSVSPDGRMVRPATFKTSSYELEFPSLQTRQLEIYLRGHRQSLAVLPPEAPLASIEDDIALNIENVPGAELKVIRDQDGAITGQITFVIDCSYSMGRNRMEKAKRDVKLFLQDISNRGDIAVSLFAIGPSKRWDPAAKRYVDPRPVQAAWRAVTDSDVWSYDKNGTRVDRRTVRAFEEAIDRLECYGETPILAGLDKALEDIALQTDRGQLVVLMTDGFEFVTKDRGTAFEPIAVARGAASSDEAPSTPLERIKKAIAAENTELVVFSFLSDTIANTFGGMIKNSQGQITEGMIKQRVQMIGDLARIKKQANETNLSDFLKALLPTPFVFFDGNIGTEAERRVMTREKPVESFSQDQVMATLRLAADERPITWSTGVRFKQQSTNMAAKSFSKDSSIWSSSVRIAGNQHLEYV